MGSSGIEAAILIISSAVAVAVNTVTGGGSLITIPVLLALGIPLKQSVGVNMVALSIGGIGSVLGGMKSLKQTSTESLSILLPTAIGAMTGSILLVITPIEFLKLIIPGLILIATLSLFIPQSRWRLKNQWVWSFVFVFLASTYGGFFGAGMGVMLVSILTIFNYGEIHVLNSLKNLQQVVINTISAIVLMSGGVVLLKPTLFLVIGGLVGGYSTGKYLERISEKNLRGLMIAIGLILSAVLSVNAYGQLN
ncbi:MAG: sulfite exporter TauE/SafE family protein [Cyanobacteria bacterium J06642_9]